MIKFENGIFIIETKNSSYAMCVSEDLELLSLYYGDKLKNYGELEKPSSREGLTVYKNTYTYKPEFPSSSRGYFSDVCINAVIEGKNNLELKYLESDIKEDTLTIILKDRFSDFKVKLIYTVYYDIDAVDKQAIFINDTSGVVTVKEAKSGIIHFPDNDIYEVEYQWGKWAYEYRKERKLLTHGKLVLDSRVGACSGPLYTPFIIVGDKNYTEDSGNVYSCALHYDGNFITTVEMNYADETTLSMGINNYNFEVVLNSGDTFTTPVLTNIYSNCGLQKVSNDYYDYLIEFKKKIGKKDREIPVIYNTFIPFELDIDEEKCLLIFDKMKYIGAELFVIDDGWFKGRTDYKSGLGDYVEDRKKFPHGLKFLSDTAHQKGLLFGLWVEPEMVNKNSEFYKTHQNWILSYEGVEVFETRDQQVLDMSNDEVLSYVLDTLDGIIENYGLDYLKFDMNRYISEVNYKTPDFYDKFAKNVAKMYEHIAEKYPNLLIENCAHGGARFDYGLLPYSDRINKSDNSDPVDMLKIMEGYSKFCPLKMMGGAGNMQSEVHFYNGRKADVDYRGNMGLISSFSVGTNIITCDDKELEAIKKYATEYKRIRKAMNNSYIYRILSPYDGDAVCFEAIERGGKNINVFIFSNMLSKSDKLTTIKLKGLDDDAIYDVDGKLYHGETLRKVGLKLPVYGDYYSKHITITREE